METLKKHFVIIASISLLLLAGCSDGSSSGSGEGKGSGGNTVTEIKQSNKVLSFAKLTDAKALAGVSSESGATKNIAARAATGEDSAIVKILEDGNISSLLSFPSEISDPPQVSDMIKSETPNGTFLYIIFDNYKTRYNYTAADGTKLKGYIGQILCVHEDGAFHDILGTEGDSVPVSLLISESSDLHPALQFDDAGNVYFMTCSDGSKTWTNEGALYRYNPFTGAKTALTAEINGIAIYQFQISKDGTIVFIRGSTSNGGFLRAILLSDTDNPQNLAYNAFGGNSWVGQEGWVYDDESDVVYALCGSYELRKYIKNAGGKFDTESYTVLRNYESEKTEQKQDDRLTHWQKQWEFNSAICGNGSIDDSSLIERRTENFCTADWKGYIYFYDQNNNQSRNIIILNEDDSLNAENLLEGLILDSWYSLSDSKKYESITDEYGNSQQKAVYLTSDDVDLRFDLFADVDGFKALAEATAGKKNAEALAVLDTPELRGLLYHLIYSYSGRYAHDNTWDCYYHNFFADVLYVKNTDTLLVDSDDSFFRKSETKTTAFGSSGTPNILTNETWKERDIYSLGTEYQDSDGNPDTQKILDLFYSYCTEEGEKEFRLAVFKDEETYGGLYTDLTDNEAVTFLTTGDRLPLFYKYISNLISSYDDYGRLKFIHETCFLKDTGTSAYIVASFETSEESEQQEDETNKVQNFTFDYRNALFWDKGELLGMGTVWENNGSKTAILKILDTSHEYSGEIITINFETDSTSEKSSYSSISMKIADGYAYYCKQLDNVGYQDIHRIPIRGGVEENLFTNVSGNWEVLSFTVGGDYLYYSSYRGTAINNGRITITTKENTPLDSTFKLTSLTAY